MSLKSSFLARSLSCFLIIAALWSAGFKYLAKHQGSSLSQFYIKKVLFSRVKITMLS